MPEQQNEPPEPMPPDDDSPVPAREVADQLNRAIRQQYQNEITEQLGTIPRPINWRTLPPEDIETELLDLDEWVNWLRHTYALPPQIIPPLWHRHPELLWELSALRQDWLFCYDPQAKGNQAAIWHHDFTLARDRLRDWVTISGTRLDRDRPTRITPWPGGEPEDWTEPDNQEHPVTERSKDFIAFITEQVQAWQREEDIAVQEIIQTEWNNRS
jgi:hypothetical protein